MTIPVIVTPVVIIPENAPFSPEQRAWLSGFLAATLLAPPSGATPLIEGGAGQLAQAGAGPVLASNDDAPWHDPAMPLEARMSQAEGKPLAPPS